jgi:hypothetical protein
MRTLFDLLATDDGRAFLDDRGLFTDVDDFRAALQPPVSDVLNEAVGLARGTPLVHIGQQLCADYAPWTLTKFLAGAQLAAYDDAVPVLLWHDLYSAEAERYGMRLVLPSGSKLRGIWFAPRSAGGCEPRFLPVSGAAVEQAFIELSGWVEQAVKDHPKPERAAARERTAALAEAVRAADPQTLGDVDGAFATFLLRHRLGVDLPAVTLSALMDDGVLTASLDAYLERLDDVIAVFNEAVDELIALDVDPQVRPLGEDHLPLHYSCPADGIRLRLTRRDGHVAVATCRCETTYRFDLEGGLGELGTTGRWSPDVSLPVHHNDHASGWIVGRSTALYGLVLNAVIAKVMGGRPIPGWIPPDLSSGPQPGSEPPTLLVDYLLGA